MLPPFRCPAGGGAPVDTPYGDGPPIAGGGLIGMGRGAAAGGGTAPPSACPHELQNFKPGGVADPHFGHFPPAAGRGATGNGAATGGGTAPPSACPHELQNFKPDGVAAPHFGHFAPAAGGGATGNGAATGGGTAPPSACQHE